MYLDFNSRIILLIHIWFQEIKFLKLILTLLFSNITVSFGEVVPKDWSFRDDDSPPSFGSVVGECDSVFYENLL